MAAHLPVDLLQEILVKLPVKSLIRFICVSKAWKFIITSSNFINSHLNHNNAKNCQALLKCHYEKNREDTYTLHSDSKSLDKVMEFHFPSENRDSFYIVNCCNGVVCLMDNYQRNNTVFLWNPSIRKLLTLPLPSNKLTHQELLKMAVGFGFDTLRNDYKYVRIYNVSNGSMKMDIFRLSTGCWGEVEIRSGSIPRLRPEVATYLHGILHWLSYDGLIVGIDLAKDRFMKKMIALPKKLENTNMLNVDDVCIGEWRGSLTVFQRQKNEMNCLWVMKEYGVRESWTKLFEIRGSWRFSGVTRHGGLILFINYFKGRYIDSYDSESKETKHDVLQLERPLLSLEMKPYTESLVLLNADRSAR